MPVSPRSTPSTPWLDFLSEETRRLALFLLSHSALEPALRSPWIVEIHLKGVSEASASLLPNAVMVAIDAGDLRDAHRAFDKLDNDQPCILLRDILQRLPDYRGFLRAAFDRLMVGGHLLTIVPHQFLFERKLQMPSRRDRGHLRFYTPASLLGEVEEAIDPCRYRVRLLADHDAGFDYEAPLNAAPAGGRDIVLSLQKIAPPAWRADMEQDESQSAVYPQPARFLPPYDGETKSYRVVAPDPHPVRRLIVIKLDHRGDFMLAIPAFRVLRQEFADAEITLVCGSWNRGEAETLKVFDRVIPFDFFPEDASAGPIVTSQENIHRKFADLLAPREFDAAIDLRLYEDTRGLLELIEARHKAGFDPYDSFPWLTIRTNPLVPTRDGRAEQQTIPANGFQTSVCEHQGFVITHRYGMEVPPSQYLLYGPYVTLEPGHYEFEVLIEPTRQQFDLHYDLAAEHTHRILATGTLPVAPSRYPRITLYAAETIRAFEFRIIAADTAAPPPFRFLGLRYRRRGTYLGMHQSEAMALLAHLVALRLNDPYTVAQR